MATEKQIKHMVDRFLSWKLPSDFNPDGGIKYTPIAYHETIGTNLFTSTQTEAMIRHLVAGMPEAQ